MRVSPKGVPNFPISDPESELGEQGGVAEPGLVVRTQAAGAHAERDQQAGAGEESPPGKAAFD